jgi:predicted RNA-binding Zn-ribbon protein involved in translation (DUF1610 family)
MKFLCVECDAQMQFEERAVPGDGTFAAAFRCPACGRSIAMLANPMETQLVESLGVRIGGRTLDEQPLELVRGAMVGRDDAFVEAGEAAAREPVEWAGEAQERLARVPGFVRGMVKRIYTEYARERSIRRITPEVMDRARSDLGLEGM